MIVQLLSRRDGQIASGTRRRPGVAAGTRAAQQLKQVVTTLRMLPVFDSVNIPFHSQFLRDGTFHASEVPDQAADAMLDELVRTEAALRPLRRGSQPTV